MAEIDWKLVATTLYEELKRWGWGDFHYGTQPQDKAVVKALSFYENALVAESPPRFPTAQIDGTDRD